MSFNILENSVKFFSKDLGNSRKFLESPDNPEDPCCFRLTFYDALKTEILGDL